MATVRAQNVMQFKAKVVITNVKAIRDLIFVAETLEDAQESQPWNRDLTKAAKAMRRALLSLQAEITPIRRQSTCLTT